MPLASLHSYDFDGRDDLPVALSHQQPPHQLSGCLRIAFGVYKNIQDLTILIDRSPQIHSLRHIKKLDAASHAFMAVGFACMENHSEAAALSREVLKLDSGFKVNERMTTQHYAHDNDRSHHNDGLLRAGSPAR